jgi:hypothetical protein
LKHITKLFWFLFVYTINEQKDWWGMQGHIEHIWKLFILLLLKLHQCCTSLNALCFLHFSVCACTWLIAWACHWW